MIARRAFLAGLAAAAATAPRFAQAAVSHAAYVVVAQLNDASFAMVGLDTDGKERFRLPLPVEARAGAVHPEQHEAVVFSKSAGNFALIVDISTEQSIAELTAPEGQMLNGQGVFADSGATLLTLERTTYGAEGRVGLWDVASGYTRIGEIPSHGLAPNDLRLMPDGLCLVIANGGLRTETENDGAAGAPERAANLAYVSLGGDLLDQMRLPPELAASSIRRLALRDDGLVGFAMQWQGEADRVVPLLGLHRRGEAPALVQSGHATAQAMKNGAESVAFSADGSEIAITSSRGGRLHRFSTDGEFLGAEILTGIVGIAPHPAGFIATDRYGGVFTFGPGGAQPLAEHDLAWGDQILTL